VSVLDYQPMLNGAPYDPQPAGGAVTTLALYANPDHTGSATSFGPATRVREAVYRFTVPDSTPAGRYWPRVTWNAESGGTPIDDDLPAPLDLPVRDDLVVSPETLAVKLGVPLPLTAEQRAALIDALLDAQTDVRAYLGRPILPQVVTERRSWPPGGWLFVEQPVLEVLTETEVLDENSQPTGYWDVTYLAGLDARSDERLRPIRRVVLAQAAQQDAAVRLWSTAGAGAATDGTGAKRVRSVSAEGQSVSYTYATPDSGGGGDKGGVGGPVRWSSIDSWRQRGRRVFQRSGGQGGLVSIRVGP
jgi:choline dehydrogenase-like flavoprotein